MLYIQPLNAFPREILGSFSYHIWSTFSGLAAVLGGRIEPTPEGDFTPSVGLPAV